MTKNFIAFIAGLLILAVCLAPILAFAVNLTDEEKDVCRQHGGCSVLPLDEFKAKLREVFERGHEAGRISCGNRS